VSSAAQEFTELAALCGLILDPWQRWVLEHMLAEGADGLWLCYEILLIVARQNGKGSCLEARELGGLFLLHEPLIFHTAHRFDTSVRAFRRLRDLIEDVPDLDRRVRAYPQSHGSEGIELLPIPTLIMGSDGKMVRRSVAPELKYKTRSQTSGRGFDKVTLLVYDEAMFLDADDVGASLPSQGVSANPQVIYTASAGLEVSTQLALMRRRLLAAWDDDEETYHPERADPDMFGAEWSIRPHHERCEPGCRKHDDPYTIRSYARANPGLGMPRPGGGPLSVRKIERYRSGMSAVQFAREILSVGTYPAPADGWAVIGRKLWTSTMTADLDRPAFPAFAVDMPNDRSMTSIAVAGSRADQRLQVEVTDHKPTGAWVIPRCVQLARQHKPCAFVIDKRSAAGSLIEPLEQRGLVITQPQAADIAHACGDFYDMARDDLLRHPQHDGLDGAVAGAVWRKLGDARAYDRANLAVDISPLVAVTLAAWGHKTFGPAGDYDAGDSVLFNPAEIIRLYRMGVYGMADIARLRDSGLLGDRELDALREAGIAVPAGI